jgi:dolichol-phosphate mannosyltransferase
MLLTVFVVAQSVAAILLLIRLLPGRHRQPPVPPVAAASSDAGSVTVLVTTLNEATRIGPCLAGLAKQSPTMLQALVIDSRSTDGTRALVDAASRGDPRIRLMTDDPLPEGWIGKVWALQHGLAHATTEWILGIDADTDPEPAMVDAVLAAARTSSLDVVSFGPRFAGQTAAERWLQPALLATLVYRFGPPSATTPPSRLMANGQCFLARRAVLAEHGGYASARQSFADDISLARHLASAGVRVGFLDGSRIITVRAYESAWQMWREWGRSIDAKDATTPLRQWLDVLQLALVFAAPIPALALLASLPARGGSVIAATGVNLALLALRVRLLVALAHSYEHRGASFWLSPLADPLAFLRIVISSARRPVRWRGRQYQAPRG